MASTKSASTEQTNSSKGLLGVLALATGAVVGAVAGVTGAALVVVTAPVSVLGTAVIAKNIIKDIPKFNNTSSSAERKNL